MGEEDETELRSELSKLIEVSSYFVVCRLWRRCRGRCRARGQVEFRRSIVDTAVEEDLGIIDCEEVSGGTREWSSERSE